LTGLVYQQHSLLVLLPLLNTATRCCLPIQWRQRLLLYFWCLLVCFSLSGLASVLGLAKMESGRLRGHFGGLLFFLVSVLVGVGGMFAAISA